MLKHTEELQRFLLCQFNLNLHLRLFSADAARNHRDPPVPISLPQTAAEVLVLEAEPPSESAVGAPQFAVVTLPASYISLLGPREKCVPLLHPWSSRWGSGYTFQVDSSVLKL